MKRFLRIGLLVFGVMTRLLNAQGPADAVFVQWQAKVDPAIEDGLRYLVAEQRVDGSFSNGYGESVGIPALVGMAILSRGYLPSEGPYAEPLNRCVDYVLAGQKEDGLLERGNGGNGPMYAHNIATLFLSEVSGMVDPERQKKIGKVLPGALELIIRAQRVKKDERNRGGWRYHPNSEDSDTSCSGWALMALRSAKLNGAAVPDRAIADAVAYLRRHQDAETGTFGYTDTKDHAQTLSGMGLLCLELCGLHGSKESLRTGDYLLRTFRDLPGSQFEIYGIYYTSQGLFQLGGKYWQEFAPWLYESYLGKQSSDGSWGSRTAGPVYGTAMMVLAFTVPHRQLPIYQRDESVDEGL